MKSRILASAGLLLIGPVACSTSNGNNDTGQGGTASGTGGSAAGSGGSSSAGTGGASTEGGTGGSGGGDSGSDSGGNGVLSIRASDVGDFDNAFLITQCSAAGSGFDCPNIAAGQTGCSQVAWAPPDGVAPTGEVTGTTYSEVFNVSGGEPNRVYAVTVHVRGQVEPRTYTGGQLLVATSASGQADPNGINNLLYVGGRPGATRQDYNVFMMTIAPPAGSQPLAARDGGLEPTFYAFNAVDAAHEGNHFNFQVDETFTFRIQSGSNLTLTNHDSNCIAIKNCGNGGPYQFANAQACEAQARTISTITVPSTFRGAQLPNGGAQPFQTQFLNFQVMNIVAE